MLYISFKITIHSTYVGGSLSFSKYNIMFLRANFTSKSNSVMHGSITFIRNAQLDF